MLAADGRIELGLGLHHHGDAVTGAGAAHPSFLETCSRTLGLPVRPLTLSSVVEGVAPARRAKGEAPESPSDAYVVPAALCLGAIA